MKFLTDENVSPVIVRLLRHTRHNVWDVKEQGWQGVSDEKIMQYARKNNRVIISEDLDFGNLQRFPLEKHPGSILIHYQNMRPQNVAHRLLRFLAHTKPQALKGTVVLLEEQGSWSIRL